MPLSLPARQVLDICTCFLFKPTVSSKPLPGAYS